MTVVPPTNITFLIRKRYSLFPHCFVCFSNWFVFLYVLRMWNFIIWFTHLRFLSSPPPFSVNKESSFPHVMSPLNFRFLIFGLIPTVSIIPLAKITSTEKRLFYFMQKFSLKWAFSCGNSVRESQFVAKNKIE